MRLTCLLTLATVLLGAAAADAAPGECGLYTYRAVVERVIDGDTVVADIDLGFRTWRRGEHLRLYGIDAPEMRGDERPAGEAAKAVLVGLVEGRMITLCTNQDKHGKFGRYLAILYVAEPDGTLYSVNEHLIGAGHAEPYGDDVAVAPAPATPAKSVPKPGA